MNPRTTVLLVITALILGAILYWDHRRSVTTEEAERRAKKLIELKADEVVRLELVRSNLAIVVVKQDNRWEIREPIVARADDHAVNAILDQLEFAQRQRTIPEDELSSEALRDFGLLNPSLQLAVRDKTGTHTIFFGAETATKDAVYARVQGQKQICVVPKHVFEQANLPLDSLRSRVLMDFSVGAATRLEIKVAERVIGLAKSASKPSAEPRWSIVKPFHARADQRKVADLLAGLSAIRVSDFVSETAKDIHFYRLDEPRMELTVGTADRTITLLVGGTPTNDASKVYVKLRNTDPVYTVRADSAKKFDLHVNDLRDTQVLGFHEEDIHRIEVATPAEKVTLVKTAAFWNVAGPVAIPAEDSLVQDMLRRLKEIAAADFVADVATDLGKYGLAEPILTITLAGAETNGVMTLLVGAPDPRGERRYLKRNDEPFIYGVSSNAVAWVPTSRLAYRARRVAELNPAEITKLVVERGKEKIVTQRGADQRWRVLEPADAALATNRFHQVLELLAFLRAEQFIGENMERLDAYGLDKPTHRFTIETLTKTYLLQLGKHTDGLTYASWSDPATIFTVTAAAVHTLTNSFIGVATAASSSSIGTVPQAQAP